MKGNRFKESKANMAEENKKLLPWLDDILN